MLYKLCSVNTRDTKLIQDCTKLEECLFVQMPAGSHICGNTIVSNMYACIREEAWPQNYTYTLFSFSLNLWLLSYASCMLSIFFIYCLGAICSLIDYIIHPCYYNTLTSLHDTHPKFFPQT